MQKKRHTLLFFFLLTGLLGILSLNTVSAQNTTTNQTTLQAKANSEQVNQLALQMYQVMLGELSAVAGSYPEAFKLTLEAAQSLNDQRLFERAIALALHNKDDKRALQAAQKWQLAQPNSKDAHHFALDMLVKQKQFNQLTPSIQGMLLATPKESRQETIAAMGIYLSPNAKEIQPFYTQALQPWITGTNALEASAAWSSIAAIEYNAGYIEQAYAALEKAHAISHQAKEPILYAIELIKPNYPQFENLVLEYLSQTNASEQIRLSYTQALLQQQQEQKALEQLSILTQDTNNNPIAWLLLGALQIQNSLHDQGIQSLKTFLEKTKNDHTEETLNNRDRAYLELAQGEVGRDQNKAAQYWINQIKNIETRNSAQTLYTNLLIDTQQFDLALKAINLLPETNEQQITQKTLLRAQTLIEAKRWSQAYQYLEKINQQIHPENSALLYFQAISAMETGRNVKAEEVLKRLIQLDPNNATALNTLGYLYAEQNIKLSEAKQLIQRSLDIEPNNPASLDSLGWVELKLGNMKVGLHLLERAYVKLKDPEVAAHYGHALWLTDEKDRALTVWKIALEQDVNNKYLLNTLRQLGVHLSKVKNFQIPVEDIYSTQNITSDNLSKLIDTLYTQREWGKLYQLLNSFNSNNEIASLIDLQAFAASQLGNYDEAERLYRKAISLEPQEGRYYNNLGHMLSEQGVRLDEAKELIEKAIQIDPNNPLFIDSLGWVTFKLGQTDQAITYLRQAYMLNPELAEIGIHLGEALWQNGSKAEALLIWKDVQYQNAQDAFINEHLQQTLTRLQVKLP